MSDFMDECKLCQEGDFEKYLISEDQYWKVYLNPNQAYLGRGLIKLKRHSEDLFDIDSNEQQELFDFGTRYRNAVNELFTPDMFNYVSAGNRMPHLHIHIVPRYSSEREFHGITFNDNKWTDTYDPSEKMDLSEDIIKNILESIKSRF